MAIEAEFKGTALIPKDIKFPEIGTMTGAFGKEVLREYNSRVEKDYDNASALKILGYSGGAVVGSNPFAVVLVNQIVRENGLRTATQADLERALQAGVNLEGTYEDSGLVLRSRDEPNAYLAKNIGDQIALRQKMNYPVMIPLNGFDLVTDSSSPHSLAFKLREDVQIVPARVLSKEGNFTSEDIDFETGLPAKVGHEGNRHSYIINSGLSRLYLNGNLDLRSDNVGLADSGSNGRVFVVSAEGTSPKIVNEYLANLKKEKEAQIAQVEARYAQATKILKG